MMTIDEIRIVERALNKARAVYRSLTPDAGPDDIWAEIGHLQDLIDDHASYIGGVEDGI